MTPGRRGAGEWCIFAGTAAERHGDCMSLWEREHGGTTRGQIVTLLRGGVRSVDELANELGLTDNAVRAHLAVLLLELGGSTDVVREANGFAIRGHGCPLSEAVEACPETCSAVEQMLSEVTGAKVVESCDRNGPPNCLFRVSTPG